eukprot:766827-Hanusia_phi.AAC.3
MRLQRFGLGRKMRQGDRKKDCFVDADDKKGKQVIVVVDSGGRGYVEERCRSEYYCGIAGESP